MFAGVDFAIYIFRLHLKNNTVFYNLLKTFKFIALSYDAKSEVSELGSMLTKMRILSGK